MRKIKSKYSKKILSNSFIYKFFMAVDFALSAFCLILAILYVVGNYQEFQDSTQNIIISTISYVSIFNALISGILMVEAIFKIFTEKHKISHIFQVIFLIITIIFCIICMELSTVISYLSAGLGHQ